MSSQIITVSCLFVREVVYQRLFMHPSISSKVNRISWSPTSLGESVGRLYPPLLEHEIRGPWAPSLCGIQIWFFKTQVTISSGGRGKESFSSIVPQQLRQRELDSGVYGALAARCIMLHFLRCQAHPTFSGDRMSNRHR